MLSDGRRCDEELDALALLACQEYNLGNGGNWFLSFRGGLSGFSYRMESLREHRALVYEWHPGAILTGHERHIAIMLFCMDSAFECLVFALNAIGQARRPTEFRSLADEAELRRISPRDILGESHLSGWTTVFPSFRNHCIDHANLIALIVDNHDVTKHRESGFYGGTLRTDPPEGFFDRLGIPQGHHLRNIIAPMQQVLLPLRPKLPVEKRSPDLSNWTQLERVIGNFQIFINEAVCIALADAKATLQLPVLSPRQN